MQVEFPRGSVPYTVLPDYNCMELSGYAVMTPPRVSQGVGGNTLNSLGVYMATSGNQASVQDPYQRNFLGIKFDHCGLNAITPIKFEANCLQFQYLKNGSHVCTIDLPQPPIGTKSPTLIT
ncbi:hypothetical protein MEO39_27040, partial [Dolichospermum sp. ST_sed2]|nr:hypothetical protein [Dolichospermum sp. ST_sed2]